MRISTNELVIVLAIVLLIFGPKQIPKLVKMCKRGINSVRGKMAEDEEDESEDETPSAQAKAEPAAAEPQAEAAPAAAEAGEEKKSFFAKKKKD